MTRQGDEAQSMTPGGIGQNTIDGETPAARHLDDKSTTMPIQRDPANTLRGCQRILILGRTGSGKTTLARYISAQSSAQCPCPCYGNVRALRSQVIVGSPTATRARCATWSGPGRIR